MVLFFAGNVLARCVVPSEAQVKKMSKRELRDAIAQVKEELIPDIMYTNSLYSQGRTFLGQQEAAKVDSCNAKINWMKSELKKKTKK